MSAHGNQQGGEVAQFLRLLRGQVAAQVTQMGDAALAVAQDVDGVGAAQRALFVVMPGIDGLHRKRGRPALTQGYALGSAVVAMAVAAQDLVGLDTNRRKPRYAAVFVRVQQDRKSVV